MKEYNGLEIPVGVSLTHDKGKPVVFAYVGGKGRLGMKAKRFNPRVCGGMERALKQAIRWRKQALREHTAALAELGEPTAPAPAKKRAAVAAVRPASGKQPARKTVVKAPARKTVVKAATSRSRPAAAAAPSPARRKPPSKPAVPVKTVRKPAPAASSRVARKPVTATVSRPARKLAAARRTR